MKKVLFLSAVLAAAILFLVSSCAKKGNGKTAAETSPQDPTARGAVTEDGFLTCIFSQKDAVLPDGTNMLFSVVPYCDPETGDVTFAGMERLRDEDGAYNGKAAITLFTYSKDGERIGTAETSLAVSAAAMRGAVTEDALLIDYGTIDNITLFRWDRKTGAVTSTPEGADFFGRSGFYPDIVTTDAEGRIFCSDRNAAVVLNADLSLLTGFDLPYTAASIARGGDGAVWALYRGGGTIRAAKIDPETGGFGAGYTVTGSGGSGGSRRLVNAVLPMEYDFCFYDENGVWGARADEDGTVHEERITDFLNSGIPQFWCADDYTSGKEGLFASAVCGEDGMLAGSGSDLTAMTPVFLRRMPDLDPAEMKTIVLAHAYPLKPNIVAKIRTFPRLRPDVRIEVRDYSVYATPEDYAAGEEKLAFDILNGGFRPDIVVTRAVTGDQTGLSDRSLVPQMLKRGLLRDLTPWLEKDDYVNFDNLFGCVRTLFDDGTGGMWGISPEMWAETVIVSPVWTRQLTVQLQGRTSWTLGEMLGFFESLPEGQEAFYSANRKDAQSEWILLGRDIPYSSAKTALWTGISFAGTSRFSIRCRTTGRSGAGGRAYPS